MVALPSWSGDNPSPTSAKLTRHRTKRTHVVDRAKLVTPTFEVLRQYVLRAPLSLVPRLYHDDSIAFVKWDRLAGKRAHKAESTCSDRDRDCHREPAYRCEGPELAQPAGPELDVERETPEPRHAALLAQRVQRSRHRVETQPR